MMEENAKHFEVSKATFDYIKHLTALSTGSIILLTIFLERIFNNPMWKFLVIISILGFLLSVIFSTVCYSIFIFVFGVERDEKRAESSLAVILILSIISFLIGIISFATFAIRNLI
jgi:hypothetical protein